MLIALIHRIDSRIDTDSNTSPAVSLSASSVQTGANLYLKEEDFIYLHEISGIARNIFFT